MGQIEDSENNVTTVGIIQEESEERGEGKGDGLPEKEKSESGEVASTGMIVLETSISKDVKVSMIPGSEEAEVNSSTLKAKSQTEKQSLGENEKGVFLTRYLRRKTKGLTRSQIAIYCIFPFVEFFAATVISIQGPFFPNVALSKGATLAESGLVFGSFELIVFLMAPVYGAKMGQWNPNRIFNYGIFTTSLSCVIFGFLHHLEGRVPFIFFSLVVRSIEAIGDAAFVVASFSIIAAEFPDSVATTFALMETFYGLGMIAGPTVGGALYKLGGFTLPFLVMGCLLFISAISTYYFITTSAESVSPEKVVSSSSFDMFKMFKIPAIAITAYGTFAAATGIGFLNNSLQPHLSPFGVDELEVGSIFMLNGGVYALTAPLFGKLCDNTSQPKMYSLIGSLLTIFGFMLIGPLPFPFFPDPSILLVCIGLFIFGLGLGSTLVSAFILFLQDAIANGHPEDVKTHGLVSGLWTSMCALGFFVGPTIGGSLDTLVGFRWGTLFIIIEQLILVGLLTNYFIRNRKVTEPPSSSSSSSPEKGDNLEGIVITNAIKMKTTKQRKNKSKAEPINSDPLTDKETSAKEKSGGLENPNFVHDS